MNPSDKIRTWVLDQRNTLKPGMMLPTELNLAGTFGASVSTVRNVMRKLRMEGVVERIQGKGTFFPTGEDSPAAPVMPRTSVQRLADALVGLIQNGQLRIGSQMPPVKFLVMQYRVSPRVVTLAYRELQSKGYARKLGKYYWVTSSAQIAGRFTRRHVYFLLPQADDFAVFLEGNVFTYAYPRMERELSAHGYLLHHVTGNRVAELMRGWKSRGLNAPHGVMFSGLDQVRCDGLLNGVAGIWKTAGHKFPVVIESAIPQGAQTPVRSTAALFSIGNLSTVIARTLASFVIRQGSKRAVFVYDQAGPYSPHLRLHLNTVWIAAKVDAELKNIDASFVLDIVAIPAPGVDSRAAFLVRERLTTSPQRKSGIVGKYQPADPGSFEDRIRIAASVAASLKGSALPGFWVFNTDAAASQALDYAREHKLRVPEDIRIVSLDDDPHFYHRGLTRCVTDWDNVGHALAHAIIGDIRLEKTSKGFIRTSAMVVERETTTP
jgi:DNA-binding transcriptional regulator YhcF (GntR family)